MVTKITDYLRIYVLFCDSDHVLKMLATNLSTVGVNIKQTIKNNL